MSGKGWQSLRMKQLEELDPAEIQRLAVHKSNRLERSIEKIDGQFVTVSGWLTASLFALNAGGALTAIGAVDRLDSPSWAISIFAVGLIFALLGATLIQHFLSLTSPQAESLLTFWRGAAATGRADWTYYHAEKASLVRVERWFWTAPGVGWLSGVCFLAGGAVLALDEASPSPKHAATCLVLQTKMLRQDRKAEQSRQLFDSLKCQWQE